MIINQSSITNLFVGFKAAFQNAFEGVNPVWPQIASLVPSSTRTEKYAWLGQFPGFREWVGDRQIKNLESHDYTIKNRDFETTVSVGRNDIEDDQYGVYVPLFKEMGRSSAMHPDELVFELLRKGFNAKCYDGQPFFDHDHPMGDNLVSNTQDGNGNPWFLMDTNRSLKPLIYQLRKQYTFTQLVHENDANVFLNKQYIYGVDGRSSVGYGFWQMAFASKAELNKENFNKAKAAMGKIRSNEGRPLGFRPSLLIVGLDNEEAAMELIKAERSANGATNTLYNSVDVLVTPYLD